MKEKILVIDIDLYSSYPQHTNYNRESIDHSVHIATSIHIHILSFCDPTYGSMLNFSYLLKNVLGRVMHANNFFPSSDEILAPSI